MEPYTLLVIARSQSLAKCLQGALDAERYVIRWVPSTTQALQLDLSPSMLILDLPSSGGSRCAGRLKGHFAVPLLVVSRPGQVVPEQASAFLSRPYDTQELAKLIEKTLYTHSPHLIRVEGMALNTETRYLQLNGNLYQLRPIGCRILAQLMGRAGYVVPRDELFQRVWCTDDGDNTRALDVHIAYLRRQLESDPHRPGLILTERGVGYRLQPPAEIP